MEILLIVLLIVWLIAPIPLCILLLFEIAKRRKYETAYKQLTNGEAIPPPMPPSVPPMAQPVASVQSPIVQPPPTESLSPPVTSSPHITPPNIAPPIPPTLEQTMPPSKRGPKLSAISVMLSVGVLLVILAGMLFVRTAWDTLPDLGRLGILAAGSALFFGASAMAHKIWHLNRTGTAFFELGSAFLPISIWAAGCMDLLGETLSSPTSPWLLALSVGVFSAISIIAVRIYRQTGWGILCLTGITFTYVFLAAALCDSYEWWILLCAIYLCLLNFLSKPLGKLLPPCIAKPLPMFALLTAVLLLPFALLREVDSTLWSGIMGCVAAVTFLAPSVTERMRGGTAIPMCGMLLYGIAMLFSPLREQPWLTFYDANFTALVLLLCALMMLVLVLSERLPQAVLRGCRIAFYGLTACGLLPLFFALGTENWNVLLLCTVTVLFLATLLPALRTKEPLLRGYVAAETVVLLRGFSDVVGGIWRLGGMRMHLLMLPVLCLAVGVLWTHCKTLRTVFSDFLFPCGTVFACCLLADHNPSGQTNCAVLLLLLAALCFWAYAMERNAARIPQYFHAIGVSVTLWIAVLCAANASTFRELDTGIFTLCWSGIAYALACLTEWRTRTALDAPRGVLLAGLAIPPLFVGCFSDALDAFEATKYGVYLSLLSAIFLMIFWLRFAKRGIRKGAIIVFGGALLLLAEATGYFFWKYVFEHISFPVFMFANFWLLLAGVAAILIRNRKLQFLGDYALPAVSNLLLPFAALILAFLLPTGNELETIYPLATLLCCAIGWLNTKRTHILLPTLAAGAVLVTFHACFTMHTGMLTNSNLALILLVMLVIMAAFCAGGLLLRPREARRALSLTIAGGLVPIWMWCFQTQHSFLLSDAQSDWIFFLFPLSAAGYTLHWLWITRTPANRRTLLTIAAILGTIALMLQPFFALENTYFAHKYHILPLLALGIVLRLLYGKQTGGAWFFAAGVYGMIRLAIEAISTEQTVDLLTVMLCAFGIFVASFYVKQRKWFLLGGISLCGIAVYLRMKLFPDVGWWIYLLLAGILLICIAAANEVCKQKGESLGAKAGRLWEDWDW